MENKMSKKKIIFNVILMLSLIILFFNLILKGEDKGELVKVLFSTNKFYLILGIVVSLVFVLGESFNIRSILNILGYELPFIKAIKYGFIGFFFSGITPSATGGQPMQVYEMKNDGIEVSHSSLALLLTLVSYQIVSLVYGLIGIFWYKNIIFSNSKSIIVLIVLGLTLNILGIIFILLSIFNPVISLKICNAILKIVEKLPFINDENKEKIRVAFKNQIEEYNKCASYIKGNKKTLLKVLLVTFIQIGSLFSVSYIVYRALGQSGKSILDIVFLQAVIYLSSSFIPLPGAVGVSESNFISLFSIVYTKNLIGGAMILSRGISFYLLMIISMVSIIVIKIFEIKSIYTAKKNIKINNKIKVINH